VELDIDVALAAAEGLFLAVNNADTSAFHKGSFLAD
jgi:hypothetical protein